MLWKKKYNSHHKIAQTPTACDEAGFMLQDGRGVFGEKISESLLNVQRGKGISTAKMHDVETILFSTRDRAVPEV